ncbi:MAG: hypothetical protein A2W22_00020 [Candidatus Levybacteria bacterium RBG_16_35_11]|nr:MAG: hypothetical protein A2W22_00020 [Candidatus Levybacteria bacterium RBG_16_35_11]
MKRLLFNFTSAYIYTFIAGILVSLAANLFTTALLSKDLTIDIHRVYRIALSLFISSIGAFGVSLLLETARGKWELGGAEMDSGVIRGYIGKYMRWILLCFIIFIIGLTASIFYYSNTVSNYFIRIVGYQ